MGGPGHMSKVYFRPLVQVGPLRPEGSLPLAGGWGWFTQLEVLERNRAGFVISAAQAPQSILDLLCRPRPAIAGLSLERPRLMGILNVTPDSFSDGGLFVEPEVARRHVEYMLTQGADIIDIGGESTRPGALEVAVEDEISRTAPIIEAICGSLSAPVSIDTRKVGVAAAALDSGAVLVNDVSGFTFDSALAPLCAARHAGVFVMHSQGAPDTMQLDPRYDDVVLDVYDFLEERISALKAAGVPATQIVVDPGIGFGKTLSHNLKLLEKISLFHSLGCPILLGVSRKGFIRKIGQVDAPEKSAPGSIGVGLAALSQGVQLLRIHDVGETNQAVKLWMASVQGDYG